MSTGPSTGPQKSGWGDSPGRGAAEEGGSTAPGPRRRRALDDDDDAESTEPAPTRNNIASLDDDDEPTAFIPDLEDAEEDLSKQVAVAPSLKSSRVQTIMELDEEIDMQLPSQSEVGVDLSVLQSFLTPQEHVHEDDVPWDFELELQTIASEMQKEMDERDGTVLPGAAAASKASKKAGSSS